MCTKAEVKEVVVNEIAPIVEIISRIEKRLDEMPCQEIMRKNIRLEVTMENMEKLRAADKVDIDKLYKASREASDAIATLKEQNKGQDAWSAKIWVFILLAIQTVIGVAAYFITRG